MKLLIWSILANFIAACLAFFQLQGHYVWPNKPFLQSFVYIYCISALIAPLYWYSTKWSYEHFGAFWNMRLAGFGISTLVFGMLAWTLIGEVPTMKTIVSLLLALSIILIQITNL